MPTNIAQNPATTQNDIAFSKANALRKTMHSGSIDAQKAREVAQEFESVFMSVMLAPMFSGDSLNNSLSGSHAEDTYKGLLVEEYAKEITRSGGIGMADHIYRELMAFQEIEK